MAGRVRELNIGSSAARAKNTEIRNNPYWRRLDAKLHLGYRRGTKGGTWLCRYYTGNGKYERSVVGVADDNLTADGSTVLDFDQAQERAAEIYSKAFAAAGPLTVRQACESYIEYLRDEKKTADDAERRLARHVLPAIGDTAVAALTMGEIEKVKRKMVKRDADNPEVERRSKATANRTLTSLKAALNKVFAADPKLSDHAWRKVRPYQSVDGARQIFLDEAQSRRLINVTQGAFRIFVTAALLTGLRPPHELALLHVRDLHIKAGTLRVDGKTGKRTVWLTDEAVRFFAGIAAGRAPDDLLLPKDDGLSWAKSHHIRPMHDAVKRAKLPKGFTAYGMRHTYASLALVGGMNLQFLAENLGTSVAMIEKHYGKFSTAARRELIEATGPKLGLAKGGKVVALRG